MQNCDVLIVGGGPAGAAAAITAVKAGLQVILCESQALEHMHAPGETVHPGVEPLFNQLGLLQQIHAHDFIRHSGIWFRNSFGTRFQPYAPKHHSKWYGYQLWRPTLAKVMLGYAEQLGVKIHYLNHVSALIPCQQHVLVHSKKFSIKAAWVIDSSGRALLSTRLLELKRQYASPRLVCRWGYLYSPKCTQLTPSPLFVWESIQGRVGWTWYAMVKPCIVQWTRLSLGASICSKWWPHHLVTGAHPIKFGGADVTWSITKATIAQRILRVGDAALVLDPASSHGILRALMTGIYAAHNIVGVYEGYLKVADAEKLHQSFIKQWFCYDVFELAQQYKNAIGIDLMLGKFKEESRHQLRTILP